MQPFQERKAWVKKDIHLTQVLRVDSELLNQIREVYVESFPPDERRSLDRPLLENPRYSLHAALQETRFIGFVSAWDLDDFIFWEHVSIHKEFRNSGFGTTIFSHLLNTATKPIICEIERPDDTLKQKRYRFYQRLGFAMNTYAYHQPPYGPDKQAIPMLLISYPAPLSSHVFTSIAEKIKTTVYGLPGSESSEIILNRPPYQG